MNIEEFSDQLAALVNAAGKDPQLSYEAVSGCLSLTLAAFNNAAIKAMVEAVDAEEQKAADHRRKIN